MQGVDERGGGVGVKVIRSAPPLSVHTEGYTAREMNREIHP